MRIKTRWIGVGLAIGLGFGSSGCGGDDDTGTGGGGTGGTSAAAGHGAAGQSGGNTQSMLPPGVSGKKLTELSAAQAMQTCEAIAHQASVAISDEDAARLACTLLAVLLNGQAGADGKLTVDVAKCKQSVDACVMQGGGTTTTKYDCDPSQFPAQIMACDASVAELSGCVDASLAATQMLVDEVRCDNVSSMPSGALQGMQTVPECSALQTKCPGLNFGGGSDSAGPPSPTGCDDTCSDANDGFCDDGGPRSESNFCGLGTDCADCGARAMP